MSMNFGADRSLLLPFGVSAQRCAAPLPVGETGGSKGKSGGQGGGSPTRWGGSQEPSCSSRTCSGAKDGDTLGTERAKPAIPSAREGRSPFRTQKPIRRLYRPKNRRSGAIQPPVAASLYSASLTCVPQAAPCPCSPASDSARCENRRSGAAPCQCIVSGGILTVSPGFSTCGFSPLKQMRPTRTNRRASAPPGGSATRCARRA